MAIKESPVRLAARLDAEPSRWLWLVKWLLLVPHLIVLFLLWLAFPAVTFVALVAIIVTGRYPRPLFDFSLGVLRWTWRVWCYGYGALATDRYPPFSLDAAPDYPATLDIAYPEHLSRGLALVKWWLLAIPHYLVITFFVGGGGFVLWQWGEGWLGFDGGLVTLLSVFAGVALLFTGRYPRGIFDLIMGMNRWVGRVGAYAALMTDEYPPFRLDLGGAEPAGAPVEPEPPATRSGWSPARTAGVVVGALLLRELFKLDQFGTGTGFLNGELYSLMLPILFLVHGIGRGARSIAGEEEAGTLEVLLTTRVSPTSLVLHRAAALAVGMAGLGVVLFLAVAVCSPAFGLNVPLGEAAVGSLAMVLLGVEFGWLALAVGAVTGRHVVATAASAAMAVAAYVLYAAGGLVEDIAPWRGISPFDQALAGGPLGGGVPWAFGWLPAAAVVFVVAALPVFDRRDITVH